MGKQKLHIRDLTTLNFSSEVTRSLALNIMNRHFKHTSNEEKVKLIKGVLEHPSSFIDHATLDILARKIINKTAAPESFKKYELAVEAKHFDVFGNKHIEINSVKQMELAMRLPIS